jgi:hypothetical protein
MMQQGRVQIDADWNEQTSILLGYMRALTRDLFGEGAGPQNDCGFRILDFKGIESAPVSSRVKAQAKAMLQNVDEDLFVLPGRYYVGGLPVELDRVVHLGKHVRSGLDKAEMELLTKGNWSAYLDVWEEYVSSDQDRYIRDVALGGPDSCGRAKIMWRVRLAEIGFIDQLQELASSGPGRIKVWANPAEVNDSLCSIDPDARYGGAANQLYRIEIQTANIGAAPPTFKWSRDNGSITFPVIESSGSTMTLGRLGRDETTGLNVGDWVELIDDERISASEVGQMAQVTSVDPHDLKITLKPSDPATGLRAYPEEDGTATRLHALLRRWDQHGQAAEKGMGAIVANPGEKIELEDGIFVTFEAGDFRAGDYWLIPARVLTGDVEWEGPADADWFRSPDGPLHAYARLARRQGEKIEDLRCQIARLPCSPDKAPPPDADIVPSPKNGGRSPAKPR